MGYFKHYFLLFLLILTGGQSLKAQDVMARLRAKYSSVQYHKECGGWYFLTYTKNNNTFYGIADKNGNILVSDVYKYILHPGFAEVELLDNQKKQRHEEWKRDMEKYQKDYAVYKTKDAKYKAELERYRQKYAVAEQEAHRRHKIAQEEENRRAQAEMARQQYQLQMSGGNSTVLAIGAALSAVGAAIKPFTVKYEPFLNQVLAERDLLSPPPEPYNPKPEKPVEPSKGYYWKNVAYTQCSYDDVDFTAIKEEGGIAKVSKDGKFGLVDSHFKVLAQVKYSSLTRYLSGWLASLEGKMGYIDKDGKVALSCKYDKISSEDLYFKCLQDGLWGIQTRTGKEVYPCQFEELSIINLVGNKLLKTKDKGLWGVLNFENGAQMVPNGYADVDVLDWTLGFLSVKRKQKVGLFNAKGRMLIPCEYDSLSVINMMGQSFVKVSSFDGSVGLFDADGACLIPTGKCQEFKMETMGGRSCWMVKSNDLWGLCDFYGEQIIDCRYEIMDYDQELCAILAVKPDSRGVIIDFSGKEYDMWPYEGIDHTEGDSYLTQYDRNRKKYVVMDFLGNVLARYTREMSHEKEQQFVLRRVEAYVKKVARWGGIYDIDALKDSLLQKTRVAHREYLSTLDKKQSQRKTFSWYAQNYVERLVNEWQRKGEFEKTADYHKRVNEDTRRLKILSLTKEAQEEYLASMVKKLPQDQVEIIGEYDSDNETYRISSKNANKEMLVHVPIRDAQEFRTTFASIQKEPRWVIMNDSIGVSNYQFVMAQGQSYAYNDKESLKWGIPDVEYRFDPISIDKSALNMGYAQGQQRISVKSLMRQKSDVDINIPSAMQVCQNKFAFIVANEVYENEPAVDFAFNDGAIFRDYCINALGIPSKQVTFIPNATLNQMKRVVNQMRETAGAYEGEAELIFYYAGHGIPDETTREAYMLPSDGFHQDKSSGYKLHNLYAELGALKCKSVLVLLDACFSGGKRGGGSLNAGSRGVVLRPRPESASGKLIVISAASADQTANPYPEQGHGIFTYYILKKLQESSANVSLGDFYSYLKTNTQKRSIVETRASQTPTISVAPTLSSLWRTMKL